MDHKNRSALEVTQHKVGIRIHESSRTESNFECGK
uniref:Clathrin heavy chain 1-like n=1 Tax=Rhizophora mucronata TaxID=61149 RepID=A0A2P2MW74_RHIMU